MNYNPYENIESSEKTPEGTEYNPYEALESCPELTPPARKDLPRSERLWRAQKEMTPAEREEYDYAAKHPNLYALTQTSMEICGHLPIANYLKFMSAEERHDFTELSQQDQTNALLHMSLDNALWAACGAPKAGSFLLKLGVPKRSAFGGVMKGAKLGAKAMGRSSKNILSEIVGNLAKSETRTGRGKALPSLLRVEDALKKIAILAPKVAFQGFKFKDFAGKVLKKEGFHKKEIEFLLEPLLRGEGSFSRFDMFNLGELARKNYKFSKVFQKMIPLLKDKKILRGMDPTWAKMYSEPLMEAAYKKRTFEKALGELYGSKEVAGFAKDFSLRTFQQSAGKLYTQMGKTFNFGEANLEQMANVTLYLLEHPMIGMKSIMPGSKSFIFPSILPKRVVYGLGEAVHRTKKMVYEPIKNALAGRNRNYFNHILLWTQLLKQEGLYTALKISATGEFEATKAAFFTPEVSEKVYKMLTKMDDLTKAAAEVKNPVMRKQLLSDVRALPGQTFGKNDPGILMYNAYKTFSDHLYSDFVKGHFSRTLNLVKKDKALPKDILETLTGQSRYVEYELDNLFSTVNKATYGWKMGSTKRLLGRAQRTIMRKAKGLPKDEIKRRKAIADQFAYGTEKGFPAYLENYVSRMRTHQLNLANSWQGQLASKPKAAFRHPRKKTYGETGDFATMLESRVMAQASEFYLYDKIDDVVKFAKRLPPAYRDYVEADIAGTLGLPAVLDHKVAWFLTKTVGKLERFFGKEGIWDEWRVLDLGHTVNTLTYLGALGFKPFSAVRNLFQTLMNVPADLGGIKDLGTLVRGVKKSLDPKVRQKLINWGAITEFAPEIHLRPSALPFGKKKLFGHILPSLKKAQDAGLWLFKMSDRFNRYMTGGAALEKWEKAFQAVGGKINIKNIEKFAEHLNLNGRRDYVREDIIKALLGPKQNLVEAEKTFVLDVIADTQYLYGVSEAPLILRKYGALGKTGFIFQSWFMNYGALLEKWLILGEPPPAKVNRLFTAMTSAAIGASLMETMWGESTALRTVGLGPFPKEANEYMIPPSWKPIYHAIAAISNIQDPDISSRHAKAILSSSFIMAPGYLQAKASFRGAREEGFAGFSRSILRLKSPEKEVQGW